MKRWSTEVKVGFFVLAGVLLFFYGTVKVGDFSWAKKKGSSVYVYFDSVAGLKKDSLIRIAGVDVGAVEDINLEGGRAKLKLRIYPGVILRQNSRAFIKQMGFMGEKYIELVPGSPDFPQLVSGQYISEGVSPVGLDEILVQLSAIAKNIEGITSTLDSVISAEEGEASLKEILVNFREMVVNLNIMVKDNSERIDGIMSNFETFSGDLKTFSAENRAELTAAIHDFQQVAATLQERIDTITADLSNLSRQSSDLINENRDRITATMQNLQDASAKLDSTLNSAQQLADNLEQGQGTLGKLIKNDDVYNNLNETLVSAKEYLAKAESFKTFIDYHGEYLTEAEGLKSYLTLTLKPKADKYYMLGLVDDPRGKTVHREWETSVASPPTADPQVTETKEDKTTDSLKFTAQIAKRYYDLAVRGGIIESTGGVGMDAFFLNDACKLSVEVFDFQKNKNPHLKAALNVELMKHISISGGYDDMLWKKEDQDEFARKPSFFLGAGISFSDDDITFLMQKIPIPQ